MFPYLQPISIPATKKKHHVGWLLAYFLALWLVHVSHAENTAQHAGATWGFLASQVVFHRPPLWGTSERNLHFPCCVAVSATTATTALLTKALLVNYSYPGCHC